MSKYKVKFWCDSGATSNSRNSEIVDLVDEWHYTEEKSKEVFESEEKQAELLMFWLADNCEQGIECLDKEIK